MAQINASIDIDRRLFAQDIRASKAHAAMLAGAGLISDVDLTSICAGLDQIEDEIKSGSFTFSTALEDIHMNVESRLKELIGEPAGRLHTARSRNDQVATDFKLWVRDTIDGQAHMLGVLIQTLLDRAKTETETILPGFTHLDGIFEGSETIEIEIEAIQGVDVRQSLVNTSIVDKDQPPGILVEDIAIAENTQGAVAIPIQAFGAFENPVPLDFELLNGTATVGEDVEIATGQLLITPGSDGSQIFLTLIDDRIPEGTETLFLNVSSPAPLVLPTRPSRIEILDNEFFTSP